MNPIGVGILLPSSTILPMGKDFERGLKRTLTEQLDERNCTIEFIPEFIGQGGKSTVEEAINKLIGYHQVDVVTGILSNQVGMEVAEKFEKHRVPFIINNIGEHVPHPKRFNPFVFINSTHTWQQVWALGYWAVSKFGKRGMFVGSIYDAGYAFANMLKLGMESADGQSEMSFSIAQLGPSNKTANPKEVFKHIAEFEPDFIFSAFCGGEASSFLEEYTRSGYHKNIPLLALPFLLQPFNAQQQELEIYTAVTSTLDITAIHPVVEKLNTGNPFNELGSATGSILAEALNKKGNSGLDEAIRRTVSRSIRGTLHVDSSRPGKANYVYLVKNAHFGEGDTIKMVVQELLNTVEITDSDLIKSIEGPISGWGNPYLAV
jgi:ABC-type branched-chain amino acid transport systems, periplasmic component